MFIYHTEPHTEIDERDIEIERLKALLKLQEQDINKTRIINKLTTITGVEKLSYRDFQYLKAMCTNNEHNLTMDFGDGNTVRIKTTYISTVTDTYATNTEPYKIHSIVIQTGENKEHELRYRSDRETFTMRAHDFNHTKYRYKDKYELIVTLSSSDKDFSIDIPFMFVL